jgi:catechol 2,3-dioxygenase-like lactoylglutathione lyase family enzyme
MVATSLASDYADSQAAIEAPAIIQLLMLLSSGKRWIMNQSIVHIALVVREYDEAIAFFCRKLKFDLVEDTHQPEQDKRWVLVAPPGSMGPQLLLARASTPEQEAYIGRQTGGRVFLFLATDDFWRDYDDMVAEGIVFVRDPKEESYGTVAVFQDLYGNLWDLIQPAVQ